MATKSKQDPQLALILEARHHNPFSWLGLQRQDNMSVVRSFLPYAARVWLQTAAGWQESTGIALDDFLTGYLAAGLIHILCTDISRDGKLTGPNTALYARLVQKFPALQIQASGGVSSLDDLRGLKTTGSAGAIVGRALYEKKFTLVEALAC